MLSRVPVFFVETRYFQQQHRQTDVDLDVTADLFLCSCSRRSCSSLSRCSRACLRFSARARAASSGSLVPADGLLVGAAGVDAAAAAAAVVVVVVVGAAEGAGLAATAGEAAEAAGSTLGTAGEAADTTGGLREGGVTGAEDTTMAGTSVREETEKQRHSHEGGKIQVYEEHLKISEK